MKQATREQQSGIFPKMERRVPRPGSAAKMAAAGAPLLLPAPMTDAERHRAVMMRRYGKRLAQIAELRRFEDADRGNWSHRRVCFRKYKVLRGRAEALWNAANPKIAAWVAWQMERWAV